MAESNMVVKLKVIGIGSKRKLIFLSFIAKVLGIKLEIKNDN